MTADSKRIDFIKAALRGIELELWPERAEGEREKQASAEAGRKCLTSPQRIAAHEKALSLQERILDIEEGLSGLSESEEVSSLSMQLFSKEKEVRALRSKLRRAELLNKDLQATLDGLKGESS